jgi:hypothetical protein
MGEVAVCNGKIVEAGKLSGQATSTIEATGSVRLCITNHIPAMASLRLAGKGGWARRA